VGARRHVVGRAASQSLWWGQRRLDGMLKILGIEAQARKPPVQLIPLIATAVPPFDCSGCALLPAPHCINLHYRRGLVPLRVAMHRVHADSRHTRESRAKRTKRHST
jgi:hypothetical protein